MEKHDLLHEFPKMAHKIQNLRNLDLEFEKLVDKYHQTNREICRYETGHAVTTDEHLTELRIMRLQFKDEINDYLQGRDS